VHQGATLDEVLADTGVPPDVQVIGDGTILCAAAGAGKIGLGPRGGIVFKHRSTADREIYFLSNTSNTALDFTASLRVAGRKPSLWNADTGRISEAGAFTQQDGRTHIPLHLEPAESIFVVFGEKIGSNVRGSTSTNTPEFKLVTTLDGPWTVRFEGQGAPEETVFETLTDWAKHPDEAIRHYGGTAVYETSFEIRGLPKSMEKRHVLELGEVGVIATVLLNNRELGTVWTTPWEIDIGDHVVANRNTLQIRVANTWNNRLVADAKKPREERLSHVSQPYRFQSTDPLHKGGLLGPVRLKLER
jgi:hypothetical protein